MNHVSVCPPGSIPEEDGGKLYNSCTVFGPDGELILKHRKVGGHWTQSFFRLSFSSTSYWPQWDYRRTSTISSSSLNVFSLKIHLFDIDVPGKIRFQESETLSPGNSLSMFETREWRLLTAASFPGSWMSVTLMRLLFLCHALQRSVKSAWGFATTSGLQSWRSSTAGEVSGWSDSSYVMGSVLCYLAEWVCPAVIRLPAARLPRSLQHDDWSSALGAPAEGEVRLTLPVTTQNPFSESTPDICSWQLMYSCKTCIFKKRWTLSFKAAKRGLAVHPRSWHLTAG